MSGASTPSGTTQHGLSLHGRVAVVVGGSSGLGRAIALALAEAGADVVASARRAPEVASVTAELAALGRRTLEQTSDVGDRSSLALLRERVLGELGRVDILVNAAGRTRRTPTLELAEREWQEIFDTNLSGMLRACQVFGAHFLERGYGRIVNVASLSSLVAFHEVAAYGASKAAVAALTRSLAVEWGARGVVVNALAPGVFPTTLNAKLLDGTARGRELLARTPLGRFGKPEELAGAAVLLSSEAASFINGQLLCVDGGFSASGVNQ